EPDNVITGEVGDAGLLTEKIAASVVQHVGQPFELRPHEREVAYGGCTYGLDGRFRHAMDTGPVFVQAHGHVVGVDAGDIERHRPHELMFGPPGYRLCGAAHLGREEGRQGHTPLELASDQACVAPE